MQPTIRHTIVPSCPNVAWVPSTHRPASRAKPGVCYFKSRSSGSPDDAAHERPDDETAKLSSQPRRRGSSKPKATPEGPNPAQTPSQAAPRKARGNRKRGRGGPAIDASPQPGLSTGLGSVTQLHGQPEAVQVAESVTNEHLAQLNEAVPHGQAGHVALDSDDLMETLVIQNKETWQPWLQSGETADLISTDLHVAAAVVQGAAVLSAASEVTAEHTAAVPGTPLVPSTNTSVDSQQAGSTSRESEAEGTDEANSSPEPDSAALPVAQHVGQETDSPAVDQPATTQAALRYKEVWAEMEADLSPDTNLDWQALRDEELSRPEASAAFDWPVSATKQAVHWGSGDSEGKTTESDGSPAAEGRQGEVEGSGVSKDLQQQSADDSAARGGAPKAGHPRDPLVKEAAIAAAEHVEHEAIAHDTVERMRGVLHEMQADLRPSAATDWQVLQQAEAYVYSDPASSSALDWHRAEVSEAAPEKPGSGGEAHTADAAVRQAGQGVQAGEPGEELEAPGGSHRPEGSDPVLDRRHDHLMDALADPPADPAADPVCDPGLDGVTDPLEDPLRSVEHSPRVDQLRAEHRAHQLDIAVHEGAAGQQLDELRLRAVGSPEPATAGELLEQLHQRVPGDDAWQAGVSGRPSPTDPAHVQERTERLAEFEERVGVDSAAFLHTLNEPSCCQSGDASDEEPAAVASLPEAMEAARQAMEEEQAKEAAAAAQSADEGDGEPRLDPATLAVDARLLLLEAMAAEVRVVRTEVQQAVHSLKELKSALLMAQESGSQMPQDASMALQQSILQEMARLDVELESAFQGMNTLSKAMDTLSRGTEVPALSTVQEYMEFLEDLALGLTPAKQEQEHQGEQEEGQEQAEVGQEPQGGAKRRPSSGVPITARLVASVEAVRDQVARTLQMADSHTHSDEAAARSGDKETLGADGGQPREEPLAEVLQQEAPEAVAPLRQPGSRLGSRLLTLARTRLSPHLDAVPESVEQSSPTSAAVVEAPEAEVAKTSSSSSTDTTSASSTDADVDEEEVSRRTAAWSSKDAWTGGSGSGSGGGGSLKPPKPTSLGGGDGEGGGGGRGGVAVTAAAVLCAAVGVAADSGRLGPAAQDAVGQVKQAAAGVGQRLKLTSLMPHSKAAAVEDEADASTDDDAAGAATTQVPPDPHGPEESKGSQGGAA